MPTIQFKVNLQPSNYLSWSQPYTASQGTNIQKTRSTFYPNILNDNFVRKDGDIFTVDGIKAIYLKNNYTTGEGAFLTVVSIT